MQPSICYRHHHHHHFIWIRQHGPYTNTHWHTDRQTDRQNKQLSQIFSKHFGEIRFIFISNEMRWHGIEFGAAVFFGAPCMPICMIIQQKSRTDSMVISFRGDDVRRAFTFSARFSRSVCLHTRPAELAAMWMLVDAIEPDIEHR